MSGEPVWLYGVLSCSRLSEGKAAAIRTYQQTQAAFEDTSPYAEIKDELLVRLSLTKLVQRLYCVCVCTVWIGGCVPPEKG